MARLADRIAYYFMKILMELGGAEDSPQLTHRWNNRRLSKEESEILSPYLMTRVAGEPSAARMWWGIIPVFHLPLWGWKHYVVVRPRRWFSPWYVGWYTQTFSGMSLIPIQGEVRLLIGPGDVRFFALDPSGQQLPIEEVGRGKLGDGGAFQNLPLH